MQDIDFGRFYREKKRTGQDTFRKSYASDSRYQSSKKKVTNTQKWMLGILTGAIIMFVLGTYVGSRWERQRLIKQVEDETVGQEITTANISNKSQEKIEDSLKINPTQTEETETTSTMDSKRKIRDAITQEGESYLILAKIYKDSKNAYAAGRALMKNGLPVFLAKNGKKLKVYVGPIKGKNDAYNTLAIVKNMANFKGALMYKK